jgi:uncharacterized phage protein (TIGR01671 family)
MKMREILFRGKAINRDNGYYRTKYKNGDWVYGLLTQPYNERYDLPAEMTNTLGVIGIEVDYETIGQFTGSTDKNGVKIFEGDIVRAVTQSTKIYIGTVTFENGAFWYKNWPWFKFRFKFENVEVIGNIYDNPELIGGLKDDRT